MKKLIIFLVILLASCSTTSNLITSTDYKTAIVINKKLVPNKSTLYGRRFKFIISVSSANAKLSPRAYLYNISFVSQEPPTCGGHVCLETNSQYVVELVMSRPGEGIMMILWEGKDDYMEPYILKFRWYGD